MLHHKLMPLLAALSTLVFSRSAQARFYWDGGQVFPTMAPWEFILTGIIILALAGALIFTLVKLTYFVFAKK